VNDTVEQEYVVGDLEDEGGAPLTAMVAEQSLIGMLLMRPELVDGVRELVSPREFYDRALGRVFEGMIVESGFRPENERIIEWLGGDTVEIAGRTGKQLIGYLTSLAIDKEPDEASVLADTIMEVAERRLTEEGQTNLVGMNSWQSKMGALPFSMRNSFDGPDVDFLVEDIIPERELILAYGPSQTGKSFLMTHLGFCMARAVPFFGKRILEPIPVIWGCFEGGSGARKRMLAYSKFFGVEADVPFVALTSPVDLWSKETNVDEIIAEIDGICRTEFGGRKLGLFIVDTHNAATPGASEIDSEVVSKIRDRYRRITQVLGCSVLVVGHTNALGKHRGNEQLYNNVSAAIAVKRKTILQGRDPVQVSDNDNRPVRSFTVEKMRDNDMEGKTVDFVLHGLPIGIKDKFGKDKTSCVVTEPNWTPAEQEASKGTTKARPTKSLGPIQLAYFNAFWEALQEHGELPPPALNLPRSVRVVKTSMVNRTFNTRFVPSDLSANSAKSRRQRAETYFQNKGVVRIDNERGIVWFTGKYHADLAHITHPRQRYEDEAPMPEQETEFPE
jgi:hypothetical protein